MKTITTDPTKRIKDTKLGRIHYAFVERLKEDRYSVLPGFTKIKENESHLGKSQDYRAICNNRVFTASYRVSPIDGTLYFLHAEVLSLKYAHYISEHFEGCHVESENVCVELTYDDNDLLHTDFEYYI